MSDIDKQPPVGGEVTTPEPEKKDTTLVVDPNALPEGGSDIFWQKTARENAKEAAKYRTKAKELEKQIETANRKQLEEQGNFQKLYEQSKADLAVREQELEQSGKYKQAFQSVLQRRIEAIPEANRPLIPDYDDPIKTSEWLDANWDRISNRKFPNLDPGAGSSSTGASGGNGAGALSPEAQEVAKRLKIAPERAAQLFKGK